MHPAPSRLKRLVRCLRSTRPASTSTWASRLRRRTRHSARRLCASAWCSSLGRRRRSCARLRRPSVARMAGRGRAQASLRPAGGPRPEAGQTPIGGGLDARTPDRIPARPSRYLARHGSSSAALRGAWFPRDRRVPLQPGGRHTFHGTGVVRRAQTVASRHGRGGSLMPPQRGGGPPCPSGRGPPPVLLAPFVTTQSSVALATSGERPGP